MVRKEETIMNTICERSHNNKRTNNTCTCNIQYNTSILRNTHTQRLTCLLCERDKRRGFPRFVP